MNTKHSPGPWRFDGPLDNSGTLDEPTASTWFDVMCADGNTVAHLNLDARPDGQHLNQVQADAKLIASAPTMLRALEAIVAVLDGRQPIDPPGALMIAQSAINAINGSLNHAQFFAGASQLTRNRVQASTAQLAAIASAAPLTPDQLDRLQAKREGKI